MAQGCQCMKSEITQEQWEKIEEIIARYKDKPGSLIPVLEQVQEVTAFLPAEVQHRIAEGLEISTSMVYGVVTFYSLFNLEPRGKYIIRVCSGTACHIKGGKEITNKLQQKLGIKTGETTPDMKFTLDTISCPGTCGLAPVIMVNDEIHGMMDPTKTDEVLEEYE